MSSTSRRAFLRGSLALAGAGLLAGCRLPGHRPTARVPRLGYLHPGAPLSPGLRFATEAFLGGLRDLGYVEGENLAIEWRWAEGHEDRLAELARELVQLPVDVIVAVGAGIQAARDATATIPIIFPAHSDPIGAGLVASLARPGGNVTGLHSFNAQIEAKRLELLKESVPRLSRLAVIWPASQASAAPSLRALEQAADALALRLLPLSIRSPEDFEPAFNTLASGGADGLVTVSSPILTDWRAQLLPLAASRRLPALYPNREFADDGGLMCYGVNVHDLYRRAARYVDKVLRGTAPADLPVEHPSTFDFIVNLRTAQTLGLTIPPSILAQATEVIQ